MDKLLPGLVHGGMTASVTNVVGFSTVLRVVRHERYLTHGPKDRAHSARVKRDHAIGANCTGTLVKDRFSPPMGTVKAERSVATLLVQKGSPLRSETTRLYKRANRPWDIENPLHFVVHTTLE